MIVTEKNFDSCLDELGKTGTYCFDLETTGVSIRDRLFSIAIGNEQFISYFNFQEYEDVGENILSKALLPKFNKIFGNKDSLFIAHNAVFDCSMLLKEAIEVKGDVWCTQVMAKHCKNSYLQYTLKAVGKRVGHEKLDIVDDYIKKHKLFTKEKKKWQKQFKQKKHFEKVPLSIMSKYAQTDAFVAMKVYQNQKEVMGKRSLAGHGLKLPPLINNEMKLQMACARMQNIGIKVNIPYVEAAAIHEETTLEALKLEFMKMSGIRFDGSKQCFIDTWKNLGLRVRQTDKGNPCFSKNILKSTHHPIGGIIGGIRMYEQRLGTYFSSIVNENVGGIVYANIRPAGTVTGRFSYSNPNLQNIPKREKTKYKMRKAFVPRPGYIFVMIDYDQQELKILFDYANEKDLIKSVKEGYDPHQATADKSSITRDHAKSVNFGIMYGMGTASLGKSIGISTDEAHKLRAQHLGALPGISDFIRRVVDKAKVPRSGGAGFITNWAGRRLYCPEACFAYKMVNHLIQSSGADVCRYAITSLDSFLLGKKSRQLLQIHDEILFEIHESETSIVPELKSIMENSYRPMNGLNLTCSVEYSDTSWGDKKEWTE